VSHAVAAALPRTAVPYLVLGLGAIVAVYGPIFPALLYEWATYPSLSHGFAIPLIGAYLVWTRRENLAELASHPTWSGLPFLAAGLVLYVLGSLGSEPFLSRMSFPLALGGGVLLLSGWAVARHVWPGVAYLFFMMPLPHLTVNALTRQAIVFDAWATAAVLPWLGVPVLRQGTRLYLANITLEVADACSSIPAIASLLALGVAYGVVRRRSPGMTLVLLAAAVPLGVLSNLSRIIGTAAGAYYLGPIAVHNLIHTWHGTFVFLLTFVALAVLDAFLHRLRGVRS
jgi:exosortase